VIANQYRLTDLIRGIDTTTGICQNDDFAAGFNCSANSMYNWMFRGGGDYGRSATLAMVLMFAVIPVMAMNIRRFRAEEAQR
jgi:ABC-type sugar transport system permease subunit